MPQNFCFGKPTIKPFVVMLVTPIYIEALGGQRGQLPLACGARRVMEENFHLPQGNALRGKRGPSPPSVSAIRKPSFHFAVRADLAKDPTFNICEPQPTAR